VVRVEELARTLVILERLEERVSFGEVVGADDVRLDGERPRSPAVVVDVGLVPAGELVHDDPAAARALDRVHEELDAAEAGADELAPLVALADRDPPEFATPRHRAPPNIVW
jgi:hypothetical protein